MSALGHFIRTDRSFKAASVNPQSRAPSASLRRTAQRQLSNIKSEREKLASGFAAAVQPLATAPLRLCATCASALKTMEFGTGSFSLGNCPFLSIIHRALTHAYCSRNHWPAPDTGSRPRWFILQTSR